MHKIKKRSCFQEREASKNLILIFGIQKIRFLSHRIILVDICETKRKKYLTPKMFSIHDNIQLQICATRI